MPEPDDQIEAATAERTILELERQIYSRPMLRHDVARYLSDDFWEVSEQGVKTDKPTVLSNLAASPLIVDDYALDDTRVQVFGHVAISTGRSVLSARLPQPDGTETPVVRPSRFVHVWVRDDGVWRTVYAHNSAAPDPTAAP